MHALIDGDVLRYEIGFAAEAGWKQPGFPQFDYVAELLDNKIRNICAITGSDECTIYLTGKTNFRYDIAKTHPYKLRTGDKPWHYANITAYLYGNYLVQLREGFEADDLMAIEQTKARREGRETVICTRDKDLRSVPGFHYGWEMGNQPQFGPEEVNRFGHLSLLDNGRSRKLSGTGLTFFYSQCLTGDSVDTVPGIPGCGPVKAFKILSKAQTSTEAFKLVLEAYRGFYGDDAETVLLEQGRLLWMTRATKNGNPILWEFPRGVSKTVSITQTVASDKIVKG